MSARLVACSCWGLTLSILLVGCSKPPRDVVEFLGGADGVATIQSATTIQAQRLKHAPRTSGEDIANYEEVGEPIDISPAIATELQTLLLDPLSYHQEDGSAKACVVTYAVRLRFTSGVRVFDVYVCYSCAYLAVVHDGRIVGGNDFDPTMSKMRQIAKRLYPNDSEIQELRVDK